MTLQRVLLHLQTELGVLFLFCFSAFGFPLGSPVTPDACVQLIPRHSQQVFINNPSAYSLSLSTQYYRFCDDPAFCGKNYIIVSIQGQGGLLRGFIVQARTPSGGSRSWGQFFPLQTGDSKVIQCQNGLTLTHTANNDKNIVRFAWIPEPGMRDQVQFVATVVQNLRTIYPGVYSAQLRPVGDMLDSERKFLIFAYHQEVLDAKEEAVQSKKNTPEQRNYFCNKFQTNDSLRVAILSICAANAGLNLSAANLVIVLKVF
uniref:Ferric-chelate reductase 1 homolog n=1 Tax=Crassostrea virginica TaxID=6565 RepID=A0A8B8BY16_CRAVI|nr:putative ferric-chelate reductase 1 homolog [Crassostrea virginica]